MLASLDGRCFPQNLDICSRNVVILLQVFVGAHFPGYGGGLCVTLSLGPGVNAGMITYM